MAKGRNVVGRFVERIYGRDGEHETLYLLRVKLLATRWGGLNFHVFLRGDADPDPHDHPWEFWTFPFTSYVEEVMDENGFISHREVKRFRWHHRGSKFVHRVLGRSKMPMVQSIPAYKHTWTDGRIVTLVWHGPWSGHSRVGVLGGLEESHWWVGPDSELEAGLARQVCTDTLEDILIWH